MKSPPDELIPLLAAVEVFRQLRQYWVEEAGLSGYKAGLPSPLMGEALGAINGLITDIQDATTIMEKLRVQMPDEYAAFCRAVERL